MQRKSVAVITALFLAILVGMLGGSLAFFKLNIVDEDGGVLLSKEYPVAFGFKFKVKLCYGGDYTAYCNDFVLGKDALCGINEDLYPDIYEMAEQYKVQPQNAGVTFDGTRFSYVKEKTGSVIDVSALTKDIVCGFGKNTTVTAVRNPVLPSIKTADLKDAIAVRGVFTTDFTGSAEGRMINIKTASARLNGTRVESGEEFSFNKTTGNRTLENGYLNARIIENGRFTDGVGGGVCQVSTTLYNAVLLTGLKVTSLYHHSLPVNYVPASQDAMVSDGADFCFRNDTPYPVFISSAVIGTKVTVKIYCADLLNGVTPNVISEVIREIPCSEYHDSEGNEYGELPDGAEEIIPPKNGVESRLILEYRRGESILSRKVVRKDVYGGRAGLLQKTRTIER